MLLNFFDINSGSGESSIELHTGDLPGLGFEVDLLVVSASGDLTSPDDEASAGCLLDVYGIDLERMSRSPALDLRGSPLRSWVSQPLQLFESSREMQSSFDRIAVIDGSLDWYDSDLLPWPPFNRLFSLLATLPMHRIHSHSVASTLLGSGYEGIEAVENLPDFLKAYEQAFRHVPDLRRWILFDRSDDALKVLNNAMNVALKRSIPASIALDISQNMPALRSLDELFRKWIESTDDHRNSLKYDIGELIVILSCDQISPVALGIHARRIVEQLVRRSLSGALQAGSVEQLTLYRGIQMLQRQGADPWLISCLHQVRCFGNWMGHPPRGEQSHRVELHDVTGMLSALQRVLADYPWALENH